MIQQEQYIGNTRTHVYHTSDCVFLPTENAIRMEDSQGYTPCSFCHPEVKQTNIGVCSK